MGDYLRSELLDRVSDGEVSFLTRTAVLDRMCGSLCDAILGDTASGRVLEQLESRNLLVIPLDRRREWYRYHHLFRELLLAELRRREPDLVHDLRVRAAAWYEANAMPEAAIEHAQAAGDSDRVARLVLEHAQPAWASGRVKTVLRWMEWLRAATSAEHYGAIAVHGSLIFALLGQPGAAERWAAAAERGSSPGILPDGSTMAGTLAYLRAILCRDGVDEMRRDAQIAWEGLSPASPYRATMLHTEGISYLVQGDHERADPILVHAFDVATGANALPLAALILAERCIVAAQRDRWTEVTTLAQRAVALVEAGRFEDYWTSALVYAWAARDALHRKDIPMARYYVGRAARLRPLLSYALPVVSVQALLEIARSYIALADPGGAAAVLRQVHDILQQRPDLGVIPARPRNCSPDSPRSRQSPSVRPLLPPPSCDFCRCCPPTSRSGRWASGCTSPRTRSRHRRTPSTESSGSHRAAGRSPACTSSVWMPVTLWCSFVPAAYLPDLDAERLEPCEQCVQRCLVPERPVHDRLDRLDRGGELLEIKQDLERENTGYPDLIAGRWHRDP